MDSPPTKEKKRKRSFGRYYRALGSAHRKASAKLETSRPLLSHLNELRVRFFKSIAAIIVTTSICFIFSQEMINYLASPIGGSESLVSIEVTENMSIFMRVSLLGGIVLAMPVIIYQAARYLLPGLKKKERIWLVLGIPMASLLFVGGVAFTWFVMIPTAVPFLMDFMGIKTQVRPLNYFQFVTNLMFWIGLCFEMPLIIMVLSALGVTSSKKLAAGWRYAFVVIAVVAAAVTPTVDPVNMGLVMLPLIFLYGFSIVLASIAGKRRSRG